MEKRKLRFSDFNISRYNEEFEEIELLGSGVYGRVFKCKNKLNGVEYAVKRGFQPVKYVDLAYKEIYAHGLLQHPNIVRNYSSWIEDNKVFLQNEYCNGGSLEELMKAGPLDERELRKILEHVAKGLRVMHSNKLAHMDIKPSNILIHHSPIFYKPNDTDEFCDSDSKFEETIYKIGDLGHATKLGDKELEEGDVRYLAKEVLNDLSVNLTKVDIFALGLTLYEVAGGEPLPKNGIKWHELRDGKIRILLNLSTEIWDLINRMIHPDPEKRPTASELICQISKSPKYALIKVKHELKVAEEKILLLEKKLEEVLGAGNLGKTVLTKKNN